MRRCLLFLLLLAAGCQQEATPRKILRLNIQQEPVSLDPRLAGDGHSALIVNMLFEGLMRMSADGPAVAGLAASVTISPDQLTYTFHLRESYWSDGRPVTAYDFEHSWKTNLEPSFGAMHSYLLFDIRNAEAIHAGELPAEELGLTVIDDHTLCVELASPSPYFLEILAVPALAPIREGVSNGPFRLERWAHEDEIFLVKNDHYWDRDQVHLDGIRLSMVGDAQSALNLFDRGELDWVGQPFSALPLDAIGELGDRLQSAPIASVYSYLFNTQLPLFSSQKVRQAFSLAIDREAIVKSILHGSADVAQSLLPPCLTLHDRSLIPAYNPVLAAALFAEGLSELGLKVEEIPPIVLSYVEREGEKPIALFVQEQWQEIFGVKVCLQGFEWKSYFARMNGRDFDVCHLAWLNWKGDPIYNLEGYRRPESQFNWSTWENPLYTALLEASDWEIEAGQRREFMREAEALIMDEGPIAPIYIPRFNYLCRPDLIGVKISEMGLVDFKSADFAAT